MFVLLFWSSYIAVGRKAFSRASFPYGAIKGPCILKEVLIQEAVKSLNKPRPLMSSA